MVEDAIEQHKDAALLGLTYQFPKIVFGAQARVYSRVVDGVVAVVGGRRKDGCEVDASDTQLLKVIELVYHPAQVASVEVASPGRLFGDGVPLHIEHRAAVGLIQPFAKILRIATR